MYTHIQTKKGVECKENIHVTANIFGVASTDEEQVCSKLHFFGASTHLNFGALRCVSCCCGSCLKILLISVSPDQFCAAA